MASRSQGKKSGVRDFHARMFPLLEREIGRDFQDRIPACSLNSCGCLETVSRQLSFLRTSPVCSLPTGEEISQPSSMRWEKSGIAWGGEYLTVNSSEYPNHVVDSTLLDIVESRPKSPRYYLSPNAARGILRRAASQGRNLFHPFLFHPLKKSLEALARDR